MKILIIVFIVLGFLAFLIYKIKRNFTKKELLGITAVIIAIFVGFSYMSISKKDMLPNAFKKYYYDTKNLSIDKLSATQTNVQVLNGDPYIYKFDYIIKKDNKKYFCEASNVKVIQIENEFIFKNFKEKCEELTQ